MKKLTYAALILTVAGVGSAHAEVCFRASPFTDIFRLAEMVILDGSAGATHRGVFGNWIAPGQYSLPVVGSIELDTGSSTLLRIGLHGTNHNPAFFGNHSDCTLDARVGGAGTTSCVGRAPGITNITGFRFVSISCAGLAPSSPAQPGKAMGE